MTKVEKDKHVPVMLKEILELARPVLSDPAREKFRYFDGTLGRGGHLGAMLALDPRIEAVAFDRDPDALAYAREKFAGEIAAGRLTLVHSNYADFDPAKFAPFDFMLLDLGVSSPQLDEGRRGFSFYHEGPLDMRMDPTQGPTAADVIADYEEDELNQLFKEYGEIQKPYRVVRAIVHDRKEKPFVTTRDLAGLIERVEGWHRKGHHPATNYFLALRLRVNEELESTRKSLPPLIHGLRAGGRLAVLTFHSLEDRIVKVLFKEREDLGSPVFKKVIKPEWAETSGNPRARSAKLRVFERGGDIEQTGRLGSS
jgi:16S rRNA (cytosine1402-N4)-methyltransferase